jgi:hypothetical protein
MAVDGQVLRQLHNTKQQAVAHAAVALQHMISV